MCIASGCNGLLLYGQNGAQRQLFPETNMSSTKIDQIIRTTHPQKIEMFWRLNQEIEAIISHHFFSFSLLGHFLRDLDGNSGHFKS